jgi:diguanylate cyclase (GGDEF)-like protein
MKLTISRKLLLGYLLMALLSVLASAYALYSLQKLNQITYDIANQHYALLEGSKSMMDTLIAQETAEKKYLILKDPSLEQLFWQRSAEFKEALEKIKALKSNPGTHQAITDMTALHENYNKIFANEMLLISNGKPEDAQAISDSAGKAAIDQIALKLRGIQKNTERSINDKMNTIASHGSTAVNWTLGLGLVSLMLGIALALIITRSISRPLKQLQQATAHIAEGNLDHNIIIKRDDEIGALAKSFAYMTQRLKVLEKINLDASPLTGLPGNMAIENKVKELLASGQLFSLSQIDLDNFKPFADKYGYAWGSEVLKEVSNILQECVDETSPQEIFIGHIGGDDFVIIAQPPQVRAVCQKLVRDFKKRILRFYEAEDAQKGFIIGLDRQGVIQKFPLITISAAVVTDNGCRFQNPLDMAMAAAELKEYAKLLPGSNVVTEEDVEKRPIVRPHNEQRSLELEHC